MRRFRFSLGSMMGLVVLVALGVVALQESSYPWAVGFFYGTVILLGLGLLWGVLASGPRRVARLSFAAVGGAYLVLLIASPHGDLEIPRSPTTAALDALAGRLHPQEAFTIDLAFQQVQVVNGIQKLSVAMSTGTPTAPPPSIVLSSMLRPATPGPGFDRSSFLAIGHSMIALLLGGFAGVLAAVAAGRKGRASVALTPAVADEMALATPKVEPAT